MRPEDLSDEQAEEVIAGFTNQAWQLWSKSGGLDAVEATLGPVKEEPFNKVFQAGWKLGFAESLRIGRLSANLGQSTIDYAAQ